MTHSMPIWLQLWLVLAVACAWVGLGIVLLGAAVALAHKFAGRGDPVDVFLIWLPIGIAVVACGLLPVFVAVGLPIVCVAGLLAIPMRRKT